MIKKNNIEIKNKVLDTYIDNCVKGKLFIKVNDVIEQFHKTKAELIEQAKKINEVENTNIHYFSDNEDYYVSLETVLTLVCDSVVIK